MRKYLMFLLLALLSVGLVAGYGLAETSTEKGTQVPSASISIENTALALGIGVEWGTGKSNYKDVDVELKVRGLSVIDIGVTKLNASGGVYNLNNLEDLEGLYVALKDGASIGGAPGVMTVKNDKGVVIDLTSTSTGAKLALAPEGLRVKITNKKDALAQLKAKGHA